MRTNLQITQEATRFLDQSVKPLAELSVREALHKRDLEIKEYLDGVQKALSEEPQEGTVNATWKASAQALLTAIKLDLLLARG